VRPICVSTWTPPSQLAALENDIAALNQSMLTGDQFDNLNATMPDNSNLVKAIQDAYPALFETNIFSTTVTDASANRALLAAGQAQAGLLLTSADATALPTADAPDSPMAETMAQLEEEVRQLNARVETETAHELQAEQQRDLTWESFKALSNKQQELTLARAAGNSEVRMSSIAIPPAQPVDRVSLVLSVLLAGIACLATGCSGGAANAPVMGAGVWKWALYGQYRYHGAAWKAGTGCLWNSPNPVPE
jgi:hypothetical protein